MSVSFQLALWIHIVCVVIGFGSVLVIDTFGLLWVLRIVELKKVFSVARVATWLVWTGWVGLVASGTYLLLLKGGELSALTQIKLFFVAMIGINGVFLSIIQGSYERLFSLTKIPPIHKFRIILASTISQIGWWGALLIGVYNTNFKNSSLTKNWQLPQQSLPYIIVIASFFLLVGILGELVFKPRSAYLEKKEKT